MERVGHNVAPFIGFVVKSRGYHSPPLLSPPKGGKRIRGIRRFLCFLNAVSGIFLRIKGRAAEPY